MTELVKNIGFEKAIAPWQIAVLIVLLCAGIYWEYKKKKPRTVLRIIALFFMFIFLYLIYLSPYIYIKKPLKSALVLGRDLSERTADSLQSQYEMIVLKQESKSTFSQLGKVESQSVEELDFQIDTAFVFGYLPQFSTNYYQTRIDLEIPKGLEISYPQSIALGDSLVVDVLNLANRNRELSVAIGLDTLRRNITNRGSISVASVPKSSGYIFCQINDGQEEYHFAVRVKEAEKYVVQILSQTPDFEWKFLGDYLKKEEHSIFQKTKISKDKFKYSFYNWQDSLQISRGVATDLKILLADALAWQEVPKGDQNLILKKLKENSGTLMIRANPNSQIRLDLDKAKSTNIFSTSNNLLESDDYKYLQFSNLYGLDEVAKNLLFRKIESDIIYGVLNFQNSYQMKLAGKNEEFELLWQGVFKNFIRESSSVLIDKSEWTRQFESCFFQVWSEENVTDALIVSPEKDTVTLSGKMDFIYPERQHFMFYPKQVGWHFLQLKSREEIIPFYVHPASMGKQTQFLKNYNHHYLKYLNFADSNELPSAEKYNHQMVTIWVFILFLLSAGYLWVEDKIT